MPITTPLVTKPTMRPRSAGFAKIDAYATSVCVTVARIPTKAIPIKSTMAEGAIQLQLKR